MRSLKPRKPWKKAQEHEQSGCPAKQKTHGIHRYYGKELVQMDRAEEKFMQLNSPHNKPVAHLEHSEEFVAKVPVGEKHTRTF